ncbi:DUF2171 domain-containing protein [Sphingomonas sp.]|uniref:DUF2171 domain-containing protein n=1 Tax=Sphingomonas sp. TaxID=28214 RepID=UPI002DD67A59|nr:DUF2171 domain-containing protein [Sphingomonas sp.]
MANDRNYEFPNSYDRDPQDFGRDYGSGRDYTYSSAREYRAAGELGGRDERNFRGGGTGYGDRNQHANAWGGRESWGSGNRDYYGGRGDFERGRSQRGYDGRDDYHGSYAHDGHRFAETGDPARDFARNRGYGALERSHGRPPQGYDYQDRGFMARAGDEVRSWFGDEDAERRREFDQRYDERYGATSYGRDADYHSWRRGQIDALDRDYGEYRRENAKKFENEFGSWRSNRQGQRDSLGKVAEHMEVVGSDGEHVGTVDKVRGDRIVLTKNDADAGGRHHSIPSSWIQAVDDKVTINRNADGAHRLWRDEERSGAMFGDRASGYDRDGSVNLNRSFSGTY